MNDASQFFKSMKLNDEKVFFINKNIFQQQASIPLLKPLAPLVATAAAAANDKSKNDETETESDNNSEEK